MSFKTTLSGVLVALSFGAMAAAEVKIDDAYARSSNPMAGAAFMVIHNLGDTDDRLIGVRSDAAARTELHTHIQSDNGVMQMIHIEEGLGLPAGGDLLLQRGSDHVMFMGLTAPFEDGATIPITLIFETAGEIEVDVIVDQTRMPMPDMDHGADG